MNLRSAFGLLASSAAALGLISCSVAPGAASGLTQSGTGTTAQGSTGHLKQVHDPGRVTGTIHGRCSYRDHGQLPDPRCTPGSVDPAVTQANIGSTICRRGYTKTVRPSEAQTEQFKFHVAYPAYGDPQSETTELDHLVSLELGGSNDAANLWPQSPPTPNPKDSVENALNQAVCAGRVTLAAAQNAIASDWLTAESKLGLSTSSSGNSSGGSSSTGNNSSSTGGNSSSTGGNSSSTGGNSTGKAHCTVSASYDAKYHDYNVHVHSNQPNRTVTAKASNGASRGYHTNSSGYADVYLGAAHGDTIRVTVGAASCSTRA